MIKNSLGALFLSAVLMNSAIAAECEKTLMGQDCAKKGNGVSSHMRGNAVANAKIVKELETARAVAKAKARALAMKK